MLTKMVKLATNPILPLDLGQTNRGKSALIPSMIYSATYAAPEPHPMIMTNWFACWKNTYGGGN